MPLIVDTIILGGDGDGIDWKYYDLPPFSPQLSFLPAIFTTIFFPPYYYVDGDMLLRVTSQLRKPLLLC
jgi:hypothetical protein